jgi:hypothetical protein
MSKFGDSLENRVTGERAVVGLLGSIGRMRGRRGLR